MTTRPATVADLLLDAADYCIDAATRHGLLRLGAVLRAREHLDRRLYRAAFGGPQP